MVTQTETPTQPPLTEQPVADPAIPETQTETPEEAEAPPDSAAAPEGESAAAQLEVTEPEKPDFITRAEWEKERAEVAQRAAADAIERDRRQRQTAEARRVNRERREAEERAETADIVRATLASKLGVDPTQIADETITLTIDRAASRKAQTLSAGVLDTVDAAWDYLTAAAYGKDVDLPEEAEIAAGRIGPKLQHLVNTIRPVIAADAVEEFRKSDAFKQAVDAEIARRNAQKREGQENIVRVEGTPSVATNTLEYWDTRVAHEGEDGYPVLSQQDWATYKAIRRQHGL